MEELADLRARLRRIAADEEERVRQVRAEADRRAAPLRDRARDVEGRLVGIAEHRLGQAAPGVLRCSAGAATARWRRDYRPVQGTTWADVVASLKERGRDDALAVMERVDAARLDRWEEEALRGVGVERIRRLEWDVATHVDADGPR